MKAGFPCAVCGYLVFRTPPGSYEICPVCGWEDDAAQLRWPSLSGGANRLSLKDAQRNFARLGLADPTLPRPGGRQLDAPGRDRDPNWRMVDPSLDDFEAPDNRQETGWPPPDTLYYWRETYWRREVHH
jgi:hypothetical protein